MDELKVEKGVWIYGTLQIDGSNTFHGFICSECGSFELKGSPFCPNCGVKMSGNIEVKK